MGNDSNSGLSAAEAETLRRIAGTMIPADPAYRVPSAGDPVIFADILASLGQDLEDVRAAIAALSAARADDEAAVIAFLAEPTRAALALSRAVLQCYYRDDRVLGSLGHETSPPYPRGNVVEQGDWSLLDAVRDRKAFWRDDRGA